MSVEALLGKLDKVKSRGEGIWVTCCPAHEDRHPSMTIRELPDGRVLIHCFAGCPTLDVLSAVGLKWDDLFPERPIERARSIKRAFPAYAVLECLTSDLLKASIMSSTLAEGKRLSDEDHDELLDICVRVKAACEIAY